MKLNRYEPWRENDAKQQTIPAAAAEVMDRSIDQPATSDVLASTVQPTAIRNSSLNKPRFSASDDRYLVEVGNSHFFDSNRFVILESDYTL